MSNRWVTSDTHFNHTNICGPELSKWTSGYRHFSSLNEMNDTIIDNLNAVVKEDDVLYHLGDFAFGDKKQIPSLRKRIRCKNIIFVYGNHDRVIQKDREYQRLFLACHKDYFLRVNGTQVHMYHFPVASWDEIGRGSINLHGHCHGTFHNFGRQKDIGVDCNDFKPFNLDELVDNLKKIDIITVDHHNKDTSYH